MKKENNGKVKTIDIVEQKINEQANVWKPPKIWKLINKFVTNFFLNKEDKKSSGKQMWKIERITNAKKNWKL